MKRSCSVRPCGRFVFLWHEVPSGGERSSHFDLMFEQVEGLRTWAVESLPQENDASVRAQALPRHRIDYLEYEGEISRGRGTVKRVATGSFQTILESPQRVVYELQTPPHRGRLTFQLFADADWRVCLESPSNRGTGNSEAS